MPNTKVTTSTHRHAAHHADSAIAESIEMVHEAVKQCPRCCDGCEIGYIDDAIRTRDNCRCTTQKPCVWRKSVFDALLDHDEMVMLADRIQAATARIERLIYLSPPPSPWHHHVTKPTHPAVATQQSVSVIHEAHIRLHHIAEAISKAPRRGCQTGEKLMDNAQPEGA